MAEYINQTPVEIAAREYADKNGFTLHHLGKLGPKTGRIAYHDGTVWFIVDVGTGTAKFEVIHGLVTCSTGNFSFPHPNIEMFVKAIRRYYYPPQ